MSRDTQAIAKALQTAMRLGKGKLPTPLLMGGLCLLAAYLFFEPKLEARLGVDLPGLHQPGSQTVVRTPKVGDLPAVKAPTKPSSNAKAQRSLPSAQPASQGIQALIRSDRQVYTSPAGLRYTRGSQHGHRLKHLLAHAQDEPDRPVHGVFDTSDVQELVALVDEAYRKTLAGKNTRTRQEGDRTVCVVDLGRRIGYVGGQSGARRGYPSTNHIQLVLIEDRLITAYPVNR